MLGYISSDAHVYKISTTLHAKGLKKLKVQRKNWLHPPPKHIPTPPERLLQYEEVAGPGDTTLYVEVKQEESAGIDLRSSSIASKKLGFYRNPFATKSVLHVFWDLDNQLTPYVSPAVVLRNLQRAMSFYGRVGRVTAYVKTEAVVFHSRPGWNDESAATEKLKAEGNAGSELVHLLRCKICGAKFESIKQLVSHERRVHKVANAPQTAGGTLNGLLRKTAPQADLTMLLRSRNVKVKEVSSAGIHVEQVMFVDIVNHLSTLLNNPNNLDLETQYMIAIVSNKTIYTPILQKCDEVGIVSIVVCKQSVKHRGAAINLDWQLVQEGLY